MFRDAPARITSPDNVIVPAGRRAINQSAVDRLKDSIATIDQQVPISVLPMENGTYVLIAGLHRLEACKQLECGVWVREFQDTADAQRWEISENLARAELSAEERDEHIREWARLKKATSDPNGSPRKPQYQKGGARQIARELGLPRETVRRALKPTEPSPVFDPAPKEPPADIGEWDDDYPDAEDDALYEEARELVEQMRELKARVKSLARKMSEESRTLVLQSLDEI